MNRDQLDASVGKEFRLRPVVSIGDESERPTPHDDRWRLIRCSNSILELANVRTNQSLEIGIDHLHDFRTPDFLMLKCQVTMVGTNVQIEPTSLNKDAVLHVMSTLGHEDQMRLLERARRPVGRSQRQVVHPETSPSQEGGLSDTTPPVLAAFEIASQSVRVGSEPAEVELTAHLLDDLSGVAGPNYRSSPTQVWFRSPSGKQFADAMFQAGQQMVSGSSCDGLYRTFLRFQRFAEAGTWQLEYFLLVDECGNQERLAAADMEERGFPTAIRVIAG